jgi:prepilin-type N-terminal cleavage/methylation domain-containing protein
MKQGFTLVETLVAIGIFSILVAIGVGGFSHALQTQREVASLIATQSNASVALEEMAREVRTGFLFCTTPQSNGFQQLPNICQQNALSEGSGCIQNGNVWTCNKILDFYNANGQNVDYELANGEISRSETGPGGALIPITGDNILVNKLTFTIFGNTEGDYWPPRITISLGVVPSSTDPALTSDVLNLQTTISAREIDCTPTDPTQC